MAPNLLAGVLEAQTRNSLLAGSELLGAARFLVDVLRTRRAVAVPGDPAGDRILGAALLVEPTLPMADRSRRFDGCRVLIVAGYISGEASLSARARSIRALGALQVEVALLSRWADPIEGCDAVWTIGKDRGFQRRQLSPEAGDAAISPGHTLVKEPKNRPGQNHVGRGFSAAGSVQTSCSAIETTDG